MGEQSAGAALHGESQDGAQGGTGRPGAEDSDPHAASISFIRSCVYSPVCIPLTSTAVRDVLWSFKYGSLSRNHNIGIGILIKLVLDFLIHGCDLKDPLI